MNLNDFVVLLPCAAALISGFLIKNAVKIIPNRYIPLICAAVGVGINIWINMRITPCIFIQGLISGVAATGMFEMVRNLIGGNRDVEEN